MRSFFFGSDEKGRDPGYRKPRFLKLQGYVELVDWTGRVQRPDKRGYISDKVPKLLASLRLSSEQWKLLGKEIQKESMTMLNGLNKMASIEKRKAVLKSA